MTLEIALLVGEITEKGMFMDAEFVKDGGACMTVITGG
jgi:hypothetical protein